MSLSFLITKAVFYVFTYLSIMITVRFEDIVKSTSGISSIVISVVFRNRNVNNVLRNISYIGHVSTSSYQPGRLTSFPRKLVCH